MTHDAHVKDYERYTAEQEAFFDEIDSTLWKVQMDAAHKPADAGLDEGLLWAEQMHEEHGSWDHNFWAQEGF
jgi:hypothetical protein